MYNKLMDRLKNNLPLVLNSFAAVLILIAVIYTAIKGYNHRRGTRFAWYFIISFLLVIYNYRNFYYKKEKEFVLSLKTRAINFKSKLDTAGFILLVLWIIFFFILNIFIYPGYRYLDTVYLFGADTIGPAVFANRFVPFSSREFNFIPHNFYLIRILISLQFLICIYYLNRIIPLKDFWCRALALIFITASPFFFNSYYNLIVPDRNAIFFSILFLYNLLQFYKTDRFSNYAGTILCAMFATQFKEPVFGFYAAFACTSLLIKCINKEFSSKDLFTRPLSLIRRFGVESGVLLVSLLYLANYLLCTWGYNGSGYGSSYTPAQDFYLSDWTGYTAILVILLYAINLKYSFFKHIIITPLFLGALIYFILVFFNIPIVDSYYLCLFYLFSILTLCLIGSSLYKNKAARTILLLLCAVISISFFSYNIDFFKNKATLVIQTDAIKKYFRDEIENHNSRISVYTYNGGGYYVHIYHQLISEVVPFKLLEYYGPDKAVGYPHDDMRFTGTPDKYYDYALVVENRINPDVLNYLKKHYNLHKITDYPDWFKNSGSDVYIIKGHQPNMSGIE